MAYSLQFTFLRHTYQFTLAKGFLLLCVFFFVLCCSLGVWQLHRYAFKKQLVTAYTERLQQAPIDFATIDKNQIAAFQPVFVHGEYVNSESILIQNRVYNNKIGYEVLTPFQMQDQSWVWVDRGWVETPMIPMVQGKQRIQGYIKLNNEYQFILGNNILEPNKKPLIIQKIDWNELQQFIQHPFYPFVLRLDESQPGSLVREWIISASTPERHMAYAIQWFVMALVLLVAYIAFSCQRMGKVS